jgi:demethylmenaquinone methyltransferase/2-methoxy-6-polyprenyl-1,4-benzoquinol methylase
MGYALRHVADVDIAFAEFRRVLKAGARVCLLEITRPERGLPRALFAAYMGGLVPACAQLVTRSADMRRLMRYYFHTMDQCARPATIVAALKTAGFQEVRASVELGLFTLYSGCAA